MAYSEEDYLSLSGIQHFCFCRRQWALIHIEQQWQENLRTVEGGILHEKAHEGPNERRSDVLIVRGLQIASPSLGLRGVCDVVEFRRDPQGVPIAGHEGAYLPVPVEYKRGSPKEDDVDAVQLCAQVICLEEMLCCSIEQGFLFYGETRRRCPVVFDAALRGRVTSLAAEMHALYDRRHTPRVKLSKACRACSLADICVPRLSKSGRVGAYISRRIGEDDACESS